MIAPITHRQLQDSQNRLLDKFNLNLAYAKRMGHHPLHARLLDWLPELPEQRVLELGCGPGKYVALLSTVGFSVVGVDPRTFPSWDRLRQKDSVTLMGPVYAESLPFPDASFDHIVCLGALLYFKDPDLAFAEMRRVLKPGGRLIVRTVNRLNFYTSFTGRRLDPASRQLYSLAELERLISKHGFVIGERFSNGFWPPCCTNFWWYFQCVWIPVWVQSILSAITPSARRVNNIVFASVPA